MPQNKLIAVVSFFALLFSPSLAAARSGGPDDGLTNSPPNRQNCTECHSSFGFNSGQGSVTLQGLPEDYQPGDTYRLTLALADPNARRWGFEITSLTTRDARAGNIAVVNQQATQLSDNNNQPQYLKHRAAGTFQGQANNASWQFDWTAPAEGTGRVTFYYCGNAANNNGNNTGDRIYGAESPLSEAEPPPPPPPDSLVVSLMSGWNLISSAVTPDSAAVAYLFADLIDAGSFVILRDAAGRIFNPAERVNQIGNWRPFASYEIKLSDEAEVKFSGDFVDPSHVYMLEHGWNWISYPRTDTVHPSQVLDLIGFAASVLRDGDGHFAIPGIGVSNLPMIEPGSGMQLLGVIDEPYEFIWPEPVRDLEAPAEPQAPTHYSRGVNTGSSMSFMVTGWELRGGLAEGDELGVSSSDGLPVGGAVVEGDTLLLTVWGDDNTTEAIDGAVDGDTLIFTYWYSEGDSEEVTFGHGIHDEVVVFDAGTFMEIILTTPPPNVAASDVESQPYEFQLLGLYPNPLNPVAEITFSLGGAGFVSVGLFDISGRLLRHFGVSRYERGAHRVAITAEGLPVGIYLAGIEHDGVRKLTRAVLLK